MTVSRRVFVQSALVASAALAGSRAAFARSDAPEIDADATHALNELYRTTPRARALGQKAAGILIFPKIVKAGFLVGAQGGKGVLRVGGRARGYYTIAAASFGLQAGVQTFSYALFFMDPASLAYLDNSDGWAVGTDPSVVVVDTGAAAHLDSTTLSHKVVAVPFGPKGLMAGLALQGSKITTYNPNS